MARHILALISFWLCFFGFHTEGAASPVPRQLLEKSVTISLTDTEVWWNETTGKNDTVNSSSTTIFYFSSLGHIFARISYHNQFGSRTWEQVGSDPTLKSGGPVLATGAGRLPGGNSMRSFQDLHFEGRTLIGIRKFGENGAARVTIEFDQNFGSCTSTGVRGSDNGKPIRRITWNGYHIQRLISIRVTDRHCTIQDGNAFQQ